MRLPDIPEELLLHVAKGTPLAGHHNVRQTCRKLHALFDDPGCWRGVFSASLDFFTSMQGTSTRHTMMVAAGLLEAIRPSIQQAPEFILPEMEDKIRIAWENAIQSRSANGQFRQAFATLAAVLRPHQVDAQFDKACTTLLRPPMESDAELAHVAAFREHMSEDALDAFISDREEILRQCAFATLGHLGPRLSDAQAVAALKIWMDAPEVHRFLLESPDIMALPRFLARAEGREAFRKEVCDHIRCLTEEANRFTILPGDSLTQAICRRKLVALLQTVPIWFGTVASSELRACLAIEELIDLAARAGDAQALIILSSIAPLLEDAGGILDALNALAEASQPGRAVEDTDDEQIDSSPVQLRVAIPREVDVGRLVQIITVLWPKTAGEKRWLAKELASEALRGAIETLMKRRPRNILHHQALPAVLASLRALSTMLGVKTVSDALSASTKRLREPPSLYHRVQVSWLVAQLRGEATGENWDLSSRWPDFWSSRSRHPWHGLARLAPVLTPEQATQALCNFDVAWAELKWFAYVPTLIALVPRLDAEGFRARYAAAPCEHRVVMFAHAPDNVSDDAYAAAQLEEIDAWLVQGSPELDAQAADVGNNGTAEHLRLQRRDSHGLSDFDSVGDFDSDDEFGDTTGGSAADTFTDPESLPTHLQALYDTLTPRECTRKAAMWAALAQRVMWRRAQMLSPRELEQFGKPSGNA